MVAVNSVKIALETERETECVCVCVCVCMCECMWRRERKLPYYTTHSKHESVVTKLNVLQRSVKLFMKLSQFNTNASI